jgi:hypothetical protein
LTRVLIVAEIRLYREGLAEMLEDEPKEPQTQPHDQA